MKASGTIAWILFFLFLRPQEAAAQEPGGAQSVLAKNPLKVLVLEGAPRARGLAHGQAMKGEIGRLLRLWKADLRATLKVDADQFITVFATKTEYLKAMKKWTPELVEEIAGMAEGAGVDFNTMLVLQLPDEVWAQGQAVTKHMAKDRCSCLGFSRTAAAPAFAAQNLDLPPFYDGFQLVLHIKEENNEAFVLTFPGLIAANGMNNKSIAICCNTLLQLNSCRDGLPVACVIRGVLRQQSERDAVAFLQDIKHASGQNYVLAGPDRARDFECSANLVREFIPRGQDGVVWHTNHPLASDDHSPRFAAFLKKPQALHKALTNTRMRLECLEGRLSGKSPGLEVIKSTLRSKDSADCSVCRPNDNKGAFTFASTIAVLSPAPEFYVAPGPPDRNEYVKLRFTSRK